MVDLNERLNQCILKIQPLIQSDSITDAQKFEGIAVLRQSLRELGRSNLTEDLRRVQGNLEEMVRVLETLPSNPMPVSSFKAPRRKTGKLNLSLLHTKLSYIDNCVN